MLFRINRWFIHASELKARTLSPSRRLLDAPGINPRQSTLHYTKNDGRAHVGLEAPPPRTYAMMNLNHREAFPPRYGSNVYSALRDMSRRPGA